MWLAREKGIYCAQQKLRLPDHSMQMVVIHHGVHRHPVDPCPISYSRSGHQTRRQCVSVRSHPWWAASLDVQSCVHASMITRTTRTLCARHDHRHLHVPVETACHLHHRWWNQLYDYHWSYRYQLTRQYGVHEYLYLLVKYYILLFHVKQMSWETMIDRQTDTCTYVWSTWRFTTRVGDASVIKIIQAVWQIKPKH